MRHLVLATLFAAGCVAGEPGPFEPEDAVDDTIVDGADGKADSACRTPRTVAPYALGGLLLLPSGPSRGYVVIENEKIVSLIAAKAQLPAGMRVVETGGVVSPGLIDLHNHVHYDFIPLWNSGRRWSNRYQWARAKDYQTAVKNPYNAVKNAKNMCEAGKYGEFRGLVGGTTAIQGMSTQMTCTNGWVRNVEFTNFCEDHVRQNVLPINGISPDEALKLNAQFTSGQTRAFFVHLAEGIDDSSRVELDQLRALDLLKPQVVGIHSTALTPAQLAEMGKAGMKIVWSPLSNLLLYGKTTDIPTALANKIPVALAPDWSPSGSANLLGELKVADRINKERYNGLISDAQLVAMATSNPAMIAGLDDKVGSIAVGKYADLMVVKLGAKGAYRSLIEAKPEDVLLTTISGQALYGDPMVVGNIAQMRGYTTVNACGQARWLAVTETQGAMPLASQSLTDIGGAFSRDAVSDVIDLFQCGAAPEYAFAN